MQRALRGLAIAVCIYAVHAPAQQTAPAQQAAGLETDWDIAVVLQEISAHADRLLPALNRADSAAWAAKGAPDTYATQLQWAKEQTSSIGAEAKALSRDPEKLSACLQLFFRIQGQESLVNSVVEAMRKYQSPEAAQTLVALAAENGANRDRFQRYIVNLAAEREKEYEVMDKEAQRCRGILTAPPAPTRKK